MSGLINLGLFRRAVDSEGSHPNVSICDVGNKEDEAIRFLVMQNDVR